MLLKCFPLCHHTFPLKTGLHRLVSTVTRGGLTQGGTHPAAGISKLGSEYRICQTILKACLQTVDEFFDNHLTYLGLLKHTNQHVKHNYSS